MKRIDKNLIYKANCPWCNALSNKPCVNENGKPYEYGTMHRGRQL